MADEFNPDRDSIDLWSFVKDINPTANERLNSWLTDLSGERITITGRLIPSNQSPCPICGQLFVLHEDQPLPWIVVDGKHLPICDDCGIAHL